MKKSLALVLLLVTGIAFAHPGTYVGEGKGTIGGAKAQSYQAKLVVEELAPKKLVKVTETYQMSGKTSTYVSTFHFNDNGTIHIERNGVAIGCGYCLNHGGENMWCDYHVQTEQGPLHVNMYYDASTGILHRMGDFVLVSGVGIWQDDLTRQK